MFTPAFKKTVALSFFGHLSAFFIFSLSFGPKIDPAHTASIYFLPGGLFPNAGISHYQEGIRHFFVDRTAQLSLQRMRHISSEVNGVYLKPNAEAPFQAAKGPYLGPAAGTIPVLKKTGQAIIFHPQIPYSLSPYFKDRETVHIELMFNVVQLKESSSVQIRRKVSSGNLEADLLSMRYISRYLFTQRQVLSPNNWQTVKIDLSVR